MRIAIFSDLHLHNWRGYSTTLPSGANSRLQDGLDIIKQVGDVAYEYRCTKVVFLGDLFETRPKEDNDVVFYAVRAMRDLANRFELGNTIMLRGNHDCFDDSGTVDSLEPFTEICTVVREPYLDVTGEDRFVFIPWMAKPKPYFGDQLRAVANAMFGKHVLFMHQSVSEGWVGNRHVHGALDLADIPLDQYRRVFAGDYHQHQVHADGKFMYVGSPLQLNFGEAGQEKYIVVYDTDTDEIIKVPTNAPRFYEFSSPKSALNEFHGDARRDFLKVKYAKATEGDIEAVAGQFDHIEFELKTEEVLEERCDESVTSSDHRLMDEYLDQRAEPEERDRLAAEGLALLQGEV